MLILPQSLQHPRRAVRLAGRPSDLLRHFRFHCALLHRGANAPQSARLASRTLDVSPHPRLGDRNVRQQCSRRNRSHSQSPVGIQPHAKIRHPRRVARRCVVFVTCRSNPGSLSSSSIFALYFAFCTWNAANMGHWLSVPFLMIFLGGFAYVALKSVSFWIQQLAALNPSRSDGVRVSHHSRFSCVLALWQAVQRTPGMFFSLALQINKCSCCVTTSRSPIPGLDFQVRSRRRAKQQRHADVGASENSQKNREHVLRLARSSNRGASREKSCPWTRPDVTPSSAASFGSKASNPETETPFGRYIYIHGTPEERNIGVASSYGCIRMRSTGRDRPLRHGGSRRPRPRSRLSPSNEPKIISGRLSNNSCARQ